MKKTFQLCFTVLCMGLLLTSCSKDEKEQEFFEDEFGLTHGRSAFSEDDDWELTCENLAQLRPLLISRKEIAKRAENVYYVGEFLYQCSDSLGKTCFWNCLNEPSFDFLEGEWYSPMVGHECTEMFRLEEECGYHYTEKFYLSGEKPDPETSRPRQFHWTYDEESGYFCLGSMNLINEMGTLIMANSKYIILKKDKPIYPISRPVYPSKTGLPTNATYTIVIYKAIKKSSADKYWYTEAFYNQQ